MATNLKSETMEKLLSHSEPALKAYLVHVDSHSLVVTQQV